MPPSGHRRLVAGMVGLPLVVATAYILWVWPAPRGTSLAAELLPYVVSLLAGLPFAATLGRRTHKRWIPFAFLLSGFCFLWFWALLLLCGARGVCL